MHRWYADMPPARPRPCDRPVQDQQALADEVHAVLDDIEADIARTRRASAHAAAAAH